MPQKTYSITNSLPQLDTLEKFLAWDNSIQGRYVDSPDHFLKKLVMMD